VEGIGADERVSRSRADDLSQGAVYVGRDGLQAGTALLAELVEAVENRPAVAGAGPDDPAGVVAGDAEG
jgi:hypothetical protein